MTSIGRVTLVDMTVRDWRLCDAVLDSYGVAAADREDPDVETGATDARQAGWLQVCGVAGGDWPPDDERVEVTLTAEQLDVLRDALDDLVDNPVEDDDVAEGSRLRDLLG